MRSWVVGACMAALVGGEACVASAQDAEPAPEYLPDFGDERAPEKGVETHDGFMARASLGGGLASVSQGYSNVTGLEVDIGGGGLAWSVDVGAGVTSQLTVLARIGQLLLPAPSFEARNAAPGSPEALPLASGSTLAATLVGAGLTYYFMPINIHVTALGGLSVIHLELGDADDDDQELVRTGHGFNLDVGKEWWLGGQVGLGAGARLWWATGGGEFRAARFDRTLVGAGIVLSCTYQ